MLRVLMASGIDVSAQGSCGFTDLMTAALGFDVDPQLLRFFSLQCVSQIQMP